MAANEVTVFYLEMLSHNGKTVPAPRDRLSVVEVDQPTVADCYRFLQESVHHDRNRMKKAQLELDAELAAIVGDPCGEVHVLLVDDVPAGLAELNRRIKGQVELVQFGLLREYIGQGLGKYFLQRMIDEIWSCNPERFWVRTCTLDHPAALPNYLSAGFTLCKQEKMP